MRWRGRGGVRVLLGRVFACVCVPVCACVCVGGPLHGWRGSLLACAARRGRARLFVRHVGPPVWNASACSAVEALAW